MRLRRSSAAQVVVYSSQTYPRAQDNIVRRISVPEAIEEIRAGRAKWLRAGAGEHAIRLLALDRMERCSPSGITAGEMRALVAGNHHARDKVRWWGALNARMMQDLAAG